MSGSAKQASQTFLNFQISQFPNLKGMIFTEFLYIWVKKVLKPN